MRGQEIDGAGEGNRTLVCSLGSCRSTIELRPPAHSAAISLAETAAAAKPPDRLLLVHAKVYAPGIFLLPTRPPMLKVNSRCWGGDTPYSTHRLADAASHGDMPV